MLILDWLKEWGCSRTQGLGTFVPWDEQFVIESLSDSTIYMSYYTVAHLLQGGVLDGSEVGPAGIKAADMNIAAWDYVMLGKDFNAEECPNVSEEQLAKLRHEFEFWYPMDMRVSAKDLIRNHLTMSLYNHEAIWPDKSKMVGSYYCNGYLNLNGKKMAKSTGNFMTLRQTINKFGNDATRVTLADAGDFLDDANFDEKVANAAILKLFVFEEWCKTRCPEEGINFADQPKDTAFWDSLMRNELYDAVAKVTDAYENMKFKDVLKFGFNNLLNLKEAYIIGTGKKPNPVLIMEYMTVFLTIMNPIIPHICQFIW